MITEYHFPTPIYIKDLPNAVQLNQYLEQQVIKWSQTDPEGKKRTNVNGWHSKTDMNQKEEYNVLTKELFAMQDEIFIKEHLTQKPVLGNMWQILIIQVDIIDLTYILIVYFQEFIGSRLRLNQAL